MPWSGAMFLGPNNGLIVPMVPIQHDIPWAKIVKKIMKNQAYMVDVLANTAPMSGGLL